MTRPSNVFLGRTDTILGICEAVGQDLGFNPDYLRVGLGLALLFNPVAVIASYLGLGLIVLASRLIAPNRAERRKVPAAAPAHAERQPVNDTVEEFALAA